jgi:hypothetical protein
MGLAADNLAKIQIVRVLAPVSAVKIYPEREQKPTLRFRIPLNEITQ